ncbi:hypothetical protein D16iCDA_18110 [Pseudomonas seleniipraecipitans]|uniref:Uncharacterized protein n=1 Tax=Phytopseudomonas seleniipraecipitans TaxID=640205 RepID=A0ABY5J671_9GAMM|nr:DUF6228 family protein [Pseudomonas seleniipraecipitans]UUD63571.1 hypothetical protein D16iCDA_18110 [Pseudomonas seleniipraecipitans]
MFAIHSTESGNTLIFDDVQGDYFSACFSSSAQSVKREVWAYTDAYGLANLFEYLASHELPWQTSEKWESIEGEFMLEATCNSRGIVNFKVSISNLGITEPWKFEGNVCTELGQLPALAKSARQFFGVSAG